MGKFRHSRFDQIPAALPRHVTALWELGRSGGLARRCVKSSLSHKATLQARPWLLLQNSSVSGCIVDASKRSPSVDLFCSVLFCSVLFCSVLQLLGTRTKVW